MKMNELDKINKTLAEEARKAEEAAAVETVGPKTILDMIQDVYDGTLQIISDSDDNIIGINCPKVVKGLGAVQKVGAHTVMGSDAQNMAEDALELKKFLKAYEGQNIMHLFYCSLKIQKAGLHPEYAESINGIYYFCVNSLKRVIDEDGNTVVDFSNEKGIEGIDSELLTNILVDKLHLYVQENHYENDNYDEYDGGEDLPGDSYDRGYSDGWDAGYEDGMEDVYEENFFIDENTSVDYRVGYAYGYGHGFEEGQAELEN